MITPHLSFLPSYYNSIFLQIEFHSSNTRVVIDLYQNSAIFFFIFRADSFAMPDAWLCGLRSNLNKTHSIILRGRMQFLSLSLPILTSYARSRLDSAQYRAVFLPLKAELNPDKVLFQGYHLNLM